MHLAEHTHLGTTSHRHCILEEIKARSSNKHTGFISAFSSQRRRSGHAQHNYAQPVELVATVIYHTGIAERTPENEVEWPAALHGLFS